MGFVLMVLTGFVAVAFPVSADRLSDLSPADEYRESISGVRHILGPHQTLSEMVVFVGTGPERCVPFSKESLICVWPLSKRDPGWRPLASALGTGDRLNLVCEFPKNEIPRAEESCSVHAQRSSREYYRTITTKKRGQRKIADWRSESRQTGAQQLIDRATTVFELSTLVGDAPDQCNTTALETFCVWKTDAGTYGHGTLALSIGASFRKKVRLSCGLPIDSTPREPNSCAVQIGS